MTLSAGIPTVDAETVEQDLAAFGRSLGKAWTETGFVAVVNHGIDASVIENCLATARDLFDLPTDAKMRYHIDGGSSQRGYTPFGVETAKYATIPDRKEFWHVGQEFGAADTQATVMPMNIWPNELSDFRSCCLAFFNAMDELGRRLLAALATYLGQDECYFEDRVSGGNSILRLLHYPPCDPCDPGERAAAHEDINVITLLVGADQSGLEILRRDGEWAPVNADTKAIVCNVGDMLQRLTNHVLPSTTHRVSRPKGEAAKLSRYSIPYFLHFGPDVEIKTLPGCISADNPDRYLTSIKAHVYLEQRLAEIGLS